MMGTHDSCLQRGPTMPAPSVPVLDSSSSVLSGLQGKLRKLGGLERLVRRSRLVKVIVVPFENNRGLEYVKA